MRIYLATPIETGKLNKENTIGTATKIADFLTELGKGEITIARPWKTKIHQAFRIDNHDWGRSVFTLDVREIDAADLIVAVSYGRDFDSSGTAWEIGYAFGTGKPVLLVEAFDDQVQSIMLANGTTSQIKLEDFWNIDLEYLEKICKEDCHRHVRHTDAEVK